MFRWFRRFKNSGTLLSLVAFFASIGGHFLVLQVYAWSQMYQRYSLQASSKSTAIVQTLDGTKPCAMCKNINKKRAETDQKKSPSEDAQKTKTEKVVLTSSPLHFSLFPVGILPHFDSALIFLSYSSSPPVPPPEA
jgi:hypothetical protein